VTLLNFQLSGKGKFVPLDQAQRHEDVLVSERTARRIL